MQNDNPVQPAQAEAPTDSTVWIDRDEYERLKSLEAMAAARPAELPDSMKLALQSQANAEVLGGSVPEKKSSISPLTILTGVFAIISFIFPPAILIFLGLGIAHLVKFFKGRASSGKKVGVGILVAITAIAVIVVAGPFILFFGFLIMWQIGCWTGLGSCTTA
jgi:hypothetical protein